MNTAKKMITGQLHTPRKVALCEILLFCMEPKDRHQVASRFSISEKRAETALRVLERTQRCTYNSDSKTYVWCHRDTKKANTRTASTSQHIPILTRIAEWVRFLLRRQSMG